MKILNGPGELKDLNLFKDTIVQSDILFNDTHVDNIIDIIETIFIAYTPQEEHEETFLYLLGEYPSDLYERKDNDDITLDGYRADLYFDDTPVLRLEMAVFEKDEDRQIYIYSVDVLFFNDMFFEYPNKYPDELFVR